ncbi:MAG: DNA primase [bacterium]|nr:DNA primase [bacterium]
MARFSDEFIERVRVANPIQDVIGERVQLKKAGKSLKGLCPFHREKTPSFFVAPDKGFYHCFSCHKGGNVIQFLMEFEGLSFGEAVEQLARRAGIAIEGDVGAGVRDEQLVRRRAQQQRLYEVCQFAQQWYERELLTGERGAVAREYLRGRGVGEAAMRAFRLGYAPEGWDELTVAARKAGYRDEELMMAGVSVRSEDGTSVYDRFRGRLIFPVWDLSGNVIAFAGRVIGVGEPKYLNSPETPLYTKSRVLYPLHLTKRAIQQRGLAILCEGYMDAIMLAQHRFTYVVASCGTALTTDQAHLLKRFTSKVIVAYDGDRAGQEATVRSVGVLLEEGIDVFIAPLEGGEDPDSFLRERGGEAFRELVEHAVPFFPYLLEALRARIDVRTPHGQRELCEQVFALITRFEDPLVKGGYVNQLAGFLGVSPGLIERGLREYEERARGERREGEGVMRKVGTARPQLSAAEEHLLALVLRDPQALKHAYTNFSAEFLRNEVARKLLEQVYAYHARGTWRGVEAFLLELSEEHAALVTGLLARVPDAGEQWREALDDCIATLHNEWYDAEIARLRGELDTEKDEERIRLIMRDLQLYQKKKQDRVKRLVLTAGEQGEW